MYCSSLSIIFIVMVNVRVSYQTCPDKLRFSLLQQSNKLSFNPEIRRELVATSNHAKHLLQLLLHSLYMLQLCCNSRFTCVISSTQSLPVVIVLFCNSLESSHHSNNYSDWLKKNEPIGALVTSQFEKVKQTFCILRNNELKQR